MVSDRNEPSAELALVGSLRRPLIEKLEESFTLHHIYAEQDPWAALGRVGANVRGAVGHGMAGLTRRHADLMPNLEIFAINGVGLETTDTAMCRDRNIVVTTTPVLFDDVADLAIGLALAACRQLPQADRFVRSGAWLQGRMQPGRKFTGMRAGIVGLGRIGIEIARRLEGFTTEISYVDPVRRDVPYRHYTDLDAMAAECDILFLSAAGMPKGKGPPVIGASTLRALGPQGIFINVARGWLVDEQALIAMLADGRLGAAGLDVFEDEPNVPAALLGLDNVVLSPHIASSTDETLEAMGDNVASNLISWFSEGRALTPANLGP